MPRFICFLFAIVLSSAPAAQPAFNVFESGIADMQEALESGRVSSVELVEQYLARIAAYDQQGPALNSIVRINPAARDIAEALDAERAERGARSALHGIPILVKDNYNTSTMPTTGGSVALANFVPNANATQVQKLIDAGAIILAKTNLHEYAYGITTVGSLFGQTRNPYDLRRVPGGSSGGTGAAVAANFGAIGLGSDTCGSIRIPSSFNNLIGLRPSKGLSSIYGVMPLSHTQDVAGPLARSAEDLAILLDVVVGFDQRDPATAMMRERAAPGFVDALDTSDVSALRVGKLNIYFDDASGVVVQKLEQALGWYEEQGAEIVEIEIADLGEMLSASTLINQEFQVDLNAYLDEFGSNDMPDLGSIVANGLYHQAIAGVLQRSAAVERDESEYESRVAARNVLRQAVLAIMADQQLDAIVYPTIAQLPVQIGDPQTGSHCSLSANSGLPAISMPVGFSEAGLPVGMELLGGEMADTDLLAMAYAYEQANSPRMPPSVTPPLIDGIAPQAEIRALSIAEQGIALEAIFEYRAVSNELTYTIVSDPAASARLTAVTLAITEQDDAANGVSVHNLLAPELSQSSGSYFMTPQFREAFAEGRVTVRVFAEGLPVTGLSRRV